MIRPSLRLASFALSAIPAVFAANFDVAVGPNGNLVFYPEFVIANPGDTVNFVFHPKNHSVTQSSFDAPCVPLEGGLDLGFVPVPVGSEGGPLPNWSVVVNDTNPVWIHCEQTQPVSHCGAGMVFAINPPPADSDHSFEAFKAKAIQINGTASMSPVVSTPPPQSWAEATATVTHDQSTWLTTYTSYEGTPEPTMAAQPIDHKIIVGDNKQLIYGPMNISASIGDTVTFEFHQKNHTATQSSFSSPCVAVDGGFNSGFMPVADNATEFPTFTITINDTQPIWGYCQQTVPVSHCGSGMVFSINAVESGPNNFAAFQALAMAQNGPANSAVNGGSSTGSGSGNDGANGSGSNNNNNAAISFQTPVHSVVVALSAFALGFSVL
ncbi:hypothetical protein K435DRAFT_692209 [Dendrothele bispora CBS 962.96]|uniref:Cupredoxin n=1 Tax=Dendrothele bispora (strain CBS 962.96) TaxID=1314807 RepID=A0A4S8L282_DENBC|nr:hypothetical protein K435DRAFT_692209 [Dendrothele bispora CBS 962.96]